jgi:hypothetical protein
MIAFYGEVKPRATLNQIVEKIEIYRDFALFLCFFFLFL